MYAENRRAAGSMRRDASRRTAPQNSEVAEMETAAAVELQSACGNGDGRLPGSCAPMVFPYVPMQSENARRYGQQEALQEGTLFPGLNLPFHRELKTRFPAVNTALSELMALDFAIDELGLYLATHQDDEDALELFWSYIRLSKEGREKYVATYGPLLQTDYTAGGFRWLDDPWPWEKGGND